jgi:hypothetical protein
MADSMTDWLTGMWPALDLSGPTLLWVLLAGLLTFAASLMAVGFLLVRLPAGYFCERSAADCSLGRRKGISWWAGRLAKNLVGGAVIVLGAVMALPGVPGPGLLVMLVGITFTDFPGKRRLERWAVSRPGVMPAVNQLRRRFGKAPIYLEEKAGIWSR